MTYLDFEKKGVPVMLLGLDLAGKTSLALRLVTGKWVEDTSPTFGINFETYRAGDILLKIFDVGGHEVLRRQFWLNYASNSYGIMFVFDASDKKRTEEGKEWFWYLINNLKVENRIAFAFLANKADLECMTLEEIIEVLDLQNMSSFPKISFQIFQISVKTSENLSTSMEWFARKVQEISKEKKVLPKGIIISNTLGNIRLFLDFSDVSENAEIIIEMLSKVLDGKDRELHEERVASIVSDYCQIAFQERGEIVISLITEPDDSQVDAQRLIDLIFEHLEEKKSSTKEELVDFIIEALKIPQDEYKEIREI
ncbi:MAG: ADP-ribosylation factor-like protein [Candidatus Heimdallarchaeota archaeon]